MLCSTTSAGPLEITAQDLRGTWVLYPPAPEGVVSYSLLTFAQGNGGLQGSMYGNMKYAKRVDVQDIALEGNRLSFMTGPTPWRGEFDNATQMRLTWLWTDGSPIAEDAVVARRASRAEVSRIQRIPPANLVQHRLPLPALRELPPNGLAQTPIMGWNSWNHFTVTIDDRAVREIADALVASGLRDAGYVYVIIDDGWQGERDSDGVLHPNSKFPDMRALADYVHSKGLQFGIYSSPGPVTCANYLGSHGYEVEDAKLFASWGVDLLKYDWCSALYLYKTQEEMRAAYQKMGEALRATNRPIVYSLCNYGMFDVGKWARKAGGNLWRISNDSVAGNRWASISDRFDNNGNPEDSRPGGWNDPDMMLIDNGGLTVDESRTHMTLWVMLAAPLILGNDLRKMPGEIREILLNREVIGIDQDARGLQGQRLFREGDIEVWIKELSEVSKAVALYNRGPRKREFAVNWSKIGVSSPRMVRNLWPEVEIRSDSVGFVASIPAHGSALLRVQM